MIPPWSPSALNTLKTCGRQYHELYVLKSIPRTTGPEAAHGNRVHSDFEKFLGEDVPLPSDLEGHTDYLRAIDRKPGYFFCELKAAFNKHAKPISWDRPQDEIWARFKIDYLKVLDNTDPPCALILDFKTGKKRDDFTQLMIYALWVFEAYPVDIVDARFYWLTDHTETRKVWNRSEVPDLWEKLMPDLRQFRDAFRNDIWTPKQSGLCAGWCPVKSCEFWQPKRN